MVATIPSNIENMQFVLVSDIITYEIVFKENDHDIVINGSVLLYKGS